MEEDLFETREAAIAAYRPFFAATVQPNASEASGPGAEDLALILKIERSVQKLDLISPNEDFGDIDVEVLPFVFLPYVVAQAERARPEQALAHLEAAERALRAFIDLAKHFGLASDLALKLTRDSTQPNFSVPREEKIGIYREEKALREEAERLGGKDKPAEYFSALVRLFATRTANSLLLFPQERQILEFKARLQTDQKTREDYEEFQKQPVPKPQVVQLKPEDLNPPKPAPGACEDCSGHGGAQGPAPSVVTTFNDKIADKREKAMEFAKGNQKLEIMARMNQPSYAQPTMTGDEFDELEYTLMKGKEREAQAFKKQKDQWKAREGIEDSEDSDNEKVAEIKRIDASQWDEFKDNNEKGAGNRNGR